MLLSRRSPLTALIAPPGGRCRPGGDQPQVRHHRSRDEIWSRESASACARACAPTQVGPDLCREYLRFGTQRQSRLLEPHLATTERSAAGRVGQGRITATPDSARRRQGNAGRPQSHGQLAAASVSAHRPCKPSRPTADGTSTPQRARHEGRDRVGRGRADTMQLTTQQPGLTRVSTTCPEPGGAPSEVRSGHVDPQVWLRASIRVDAAAAVQHLTD